MSHIKLQKIRWKGQHFSGSSKTLEINLFANLFLPLKYFIPAIMSHLLACGSCYSYRCWLVALPWLEGPHWHRVVVNPGQEFLHSTNTLETVWPLVSQLWPRVNAGIVLEGAASASTDQSHQNCLEEKEVQSLVRLGRVHLSVLLHPERTSRVSLAGVLATYDDTFLGCQVFQFVAAVLYPGRPEGELWVWASWSFTSHLKISSLSFGTSNLENV